MSPQTIGLIGGIGGSVIGVIGGLIGLFAMRLGAHKSWLAALLVFLAACIFTGVLAALVYMDMGFGQGRVFTLAAPIAFLSGIFYLLLKRKQIEEEIGLSIEYTKSRRQQ